jgi:hypothetical protein
VSVIQYPPSKHGLFEPVRAAGAGRVGEDRPGPG